MVNVWRSLSLQGVSLYIARNSFCDKGCNLRLAMHTDTNQSSESAVKKEDSNCQVLIVSSLLNKFC